MQELVRPMARLSEGGLKGNADLQVLSLEEKVFLSSSLTDTSRKANNHESAQTRSSVFYSLCCILADFNIDFEGN